MCIHCAVSESPQLDTRFAMLFLKYISPQVGSLPLPSNSRPLCRNK